MTTNRLQWEGENMLGRAKTVLDIIARVAVCEGKIWVNAAANAPEHGLHVLSGNRTIALTKCLPPTDHELPNLTHFSLDEKSISVLSGTVSHGVNALSEWSMAGVDTLHLQFKANQYAEVQIGRPVTVLSGTEAPVFHAYLACHRARARLELRIHSKDSASEIIKQAHFDPQYSGGNEALSYQKITMPLPDNGAERQVTLHVMFEGQTDPSEKMNSYVFIAGAEVAQKNSSEILPIPLTVEGRCGLGPLWLKAELPVVAEENGSEITLATHNHRLTLLQNLGCSIRFAQDHGHAMEIDISVDRHVLVYVNGRASISQTLKAGRNVLHMPVSALTGEPALVQIRDQTGSRILTEIYAMLPRILTPLDVLQRDNVRQIPAHVFAQSAHRYDALRAHLSDPRSQPLLGYLPFVIQTLEAGYDAVKLAPLRFPHQDNPEVSIVIPCHNKIAVTFSCLGALLLAHNQATFEVILVDDGSEDETAKIESWVEGITVVRNATSQQFIRACNAGVAKARGRYIVLLNNDTEPTKGWLDALLDAFDRFPNVGLAGAKLLFPDGRLQDAGGVITNAGNPSQYGSRQNPWDPRFCYARQADYLSGAALMMPKTIWDAVGGLSSYLEPMYFEDTDLAFKVREAGYATWFVPGSIVYHNEGTTSGTDISKGFKRFQEVNRPKFKRHWARSLANLDRHGGAVDLEKDRGIIGRVLFIDYTTPRPEQDAGSYAAVQEARLVRSLGYKVTFLPENLAHFGSATTDMERMGVEMVYAPFHFSVADFLCKRGKEFDAIYVTRYHVAANMLPLLREFAPDAKVILNNADLHFLRTMRSALANGDSDRMLEAAKVRTEELAVMQQVDLVLSYNEVERAVAQSHSEAPIRMARCPWVVEMSDQVPPLKMRSGMSFLGNFRHHPNLEGLQWFVREVLPLLHGMKSGLPLSVYGSSMTPEIRQHLSVEGINPVGFVESTAQAYDTHRIFIAPLQSGAGIKGKVLTALARGIPTILTPVAAEGIGLRSGLDCIIASTPAEWSKAIAELETDDALWNAISKAARQFVSQEYSFAAGRKHMRAAFEMVDLFHSVD
jgi:O-antigen biosynthesis protein